MIGPVEVERLFGEADNPAAGSGAPRPREQLRVEGRVSLGGLEGPTESVTDVRGGRFVDRYALGPAKGAFGYDGKAPWSQDASGQSRVDGGETPVRSARTEAFRRAQAWWYPERATAFLLRERLPRNVFNDYNSGGYLTWRIGPKYPVYVDGRLIPFLLRFPLRYHRDARTLSALSAEAPCRT